MAELFKEAKRRNNLRASRKIISFLCFLPFVLLLKLAGRGPHFVHILPMIELQTCWLVPFLLSTTMYYLVLLVKNSIIDKMIFGLR